MLSKYHENNAYASIDIVLTKAYRIHMPTETETPAVDWRNAALERGRAAFEAAVAPEPEPTPPPWWGITKRKGTTMKKTTQTKPATPAAAPATPEPDDFPITAVKLFDAAIHDLALQESERGALARKILRMQRDKAPRQKIERLVKPLFHSVIQSAMDQKPKDDHASGMSVININNSPELDALLGKMRKAHRA